MIVTFSALATLTMQVSPHCITLPFWVKVSFLAALLLTAIQIDAKVIEGEISTDKARLVIFSNEVYSYIAFFRIGCFSRGSVSYRKKVSLSTMYLIQR